MKKENLLDILAEERLYNALENILKENPQYRLAGEEQQSAYDELGKIGLSREQNIAVEKALSATTHYGAVYGAIAYRQGLSDGIKLVIELKEE